MRFAGFIDLYVSDMRAQGRMNSDGTEREYRHVLNAHCEDTGGYDPAFTDRNDVKKTLRRWSNPNTQRKSRSVLVSFYDWTMEEGYRPDNPARQTRRPRRQPSAVYRLTRAEAASMLGACRSIRERRAIHLGICAGLRNAELRGLQGKHFTRGGFVHVSADIAKGGRERWVPVLDELAPVVADIIETVAWDEYVLPAQRWRNGWEKEQGRQDLALKPCSTQALRTLVMDIATRAGIRAHVHPHLMRHAFADHVARYAGIKNAQAALGHATVGTTEAYVGKPTLDDLAAALKGLGFATGGTDVRPRLGDLSLEARTGIEPVPTTASAAERKMVGFFVRLRPSIEVYADQYSGGGS